MPPPTGASTTFTPCSDEVRTENSGRPLVMMVMMVVMMPTEVMPPMTTPAMMVMVSPEEAKMPAMPTSAVPMVPPVDELHGARAIGFQDAAQRSTNGGGRLPG